MIRGLAQKNRSNTSSFAKIHLPKPEAPAPVVKVTKVAPEEKATDTETASNDTNSSNSTVEENKAPPSDKAVQLDGYGRDSEGHFKNHKHYMKLMKKINNQES